MVGGPVCGVAGYTIGCARDQVIEAGRQPGDGRMASRALAIEMIGWLVLGMAGGAADASDR